MSDYVVYSDHYEHLKSDFKALQLKYRELYESNSELQSDFDKSQEAVRKAVDTIYHMNNLGVDERSRILDLISEAEI